MGIRSNFDADESTDSNTVQSPHVNTQPNAATMSKGAPMPDLGLINPLIQDQEVTEIMINDLRNIAIEKRGQIIVTPVRFKSIDELNRIVRILLEPTGRTLTPRTSTSNGHSTGWLQSSHCSPSGNGNRAMHYYSSFS